MTSNLEYFRTAAAKLKIISIILLGTTLALIAVGFFGSKYSLNRDEVRGEIGDDYVFPWGEIYLLVASAVLLCASVINLIIYVASKELYWNRRTAIVDFFYHCAAFLLISTSGVMAIVSAVHVFQINCKTSNECQLFEVKFAAGGMALITSLFLGVIASVVLTNRKDVERDGLMAEAD